MKVGLVVRAERTRGIGIQSRALFDHLDPFRVLVVDIGEFEAQPIYPEDYGPRATVVQMEADGTLPERKVRRWLARCDVVVTVETFYDWRVCDWARDCGARTVVQLNPEFYRHSMYRLPHPDGWWNPTSWRMEVLPEGTRHVPVPVDLTKFPDRHRWRDLPPRPPRFLHSVGRHSIYDRAGTETFSRACHLARDVDATITTLEPLPDAIQPAGDWAQVTVGAVDHYWQAYTGFDVLVLPRRYGGLSLPTIEAMAAGLAVVMPAASPNQDWPIVPVAATRGGRVPLPAGWMPLIDVDAGQLANTLIRLRDDPGEVAAARERSLEWAESNSWDALLPMYWAELERVINDPMPAPKVDQRQINPFAAKG